MDNIKVFACPTAENFTDEICACLGIERGKLNSFKFTNDNNFLQLLESVRGYDVYIVQTTQPPVNERIMELLIALETIKRSGAKKVTAVLPYYMYSRSDKKDQSRVPVTAKLIAKLLESAGADHVLTCDLHNPAIQAYFDILCDRVSAKHLLEQYFIDKKLDNMVVVATDAGSSKKAYKYSKSFGCPLALIDKRRESNNDSAVATNIIGDVVGKNAIIFDDEVSTAGTLVEAANILKEHGAKEIYAGATHGVLVGPAIERIEKSPIKELVVTNTIPLEENKKISKITTISIAPLFAEAIERLHTDKPLSGLYDYDK